MAAKILKLDPVNPDRPLKEAARLLCQGKMIIFPTDTLYGIGVDIYDEKAIKKIFEIKKRDPDSPILILIEKREDLGPLVKKVSPEADRIMARYWPAPLTLIFEASDRISPFLTGKKGTIGIRCPANLQVRRLLSFTGFPLTATSANLSNQTPVVDAKEAERVFGDKVDLILDGGPLVSEPSTLLDMTGEKIRIIREGKFKV